MSYRCLVLSEKIVISGYTVLTDRLYTREDEWVKIEGSMAYIGITDYAQKQLKDIVGIDLPILNRFYRKGEVLAYVDSVKATAEVYVPLSGRVIDVNQELANDPQLMNRDPYNAGWIAVIELSDIDEARSLLTAEEYASYIESRVR